ncbi:hypothetical protein EVAR_94773_1 [Eumeta japonica]|uniref:Uncharacterized protein n=1 Tax=Eumeta variegata TaxID=151549 RepID=A0A4C2AAZ0_EUMVA|nr:hypothetical protein EVAR_94773_1 [Eumeta japonica]
MDSTIKRSNSKAKINPAAAVALSDSVRRAVQLPAHPRRLLRGRKAGCKAFHVRAVRRRREGLPLFCPPGTLFHQEAQTCTDWGDDDPLACPRTSTTVSSISTRSDPITYSNNITEYTKYKLHLTDKKIFETRSRAELQGPTARTGARSAARACLICAPRTLPTSLADNERGRRLCTRSRPRPLRHPLCPDSHSDGHPEGDRDRAAPDHRTARRQRLPLSRATPLRSNTQTQLLHLPVFTAVASQYFIKKDIPTDVHKTNYEGQSASKSARRQGTPPATVRNSFNVSPLEPTEFNYEPSPKLHRLDDRLYDITRRPALNLNTVAYKTNIGFDAHSVNYAERRDDGQYRPSADDDDGMYRPEIYDRELLRRALAQHRRQRQSPARRPEAVAAQPQRSAQATQRPQAPFSQTQRTQPPSTQRTFDLFQTYTTTSRPSDIPPDPPSLNPITSAATGHPTTPIFATKVAGIHLILGRQPLERLRRRPAPAAPAHRPQPANNGPSTPQQGGRQLRLRHYDTDSGFSEYEHIEEFGKTNKNV